MRFSAPTEPLGRREFIALIAMCMATVAFSIDAMLPAISQIGADLSPADPLRAQMIVPVFVIGMGVGTLFTGPLSDRYGRRPVLLAGGAIYCLGAVLAWMAPSLELLLAARVLQGLGASGARVVSMAIVRDRFSGREMAQVTSFVIMVFSLVPAFAPMLGAGIIWVSGWRGVFAAFLVFVLVTGTWFTLRQPETLSPERRRPIDIAQLRHAIGEIWGNPLVRRTIAAQVCCYAMLFTTLSSTETVFDRVMGAHDTFPFWFGAIALVSMSGSILNVRLVVRLGMYRIITLALMLQIAATAVYVAALKTGAVPMDWIAPFFVWHAITFAVVAMTLGNLNAMALEPLGHLAGTASSVMTAVGTVGAGLIAIPAAGLFDGTQVPMLVSILVFALLGRLLLSGRTFEPLPDPV